MFLRVFPYQHDSCFHCSSSVYKRSLVARYLLILANSSYSKKFTLKAVYYSRTSFNYLLNLRKNEDLLSNNAHGIFGFDGYNIDEWQS